MRQILKGALTLTLFQIHLIASSQHQMCITIDDLPVVHYGIADSAYQRAVFHGIMDALKAHQAPAVGFVNEIKLYHNEAMMNHQVALLRDWVAAGLDLGNHTYSHIDYNNATFEEYTSDLIRGETYTAQVLTEAGQKLRYFRHPYLHTGQTKERADSLEVFLVKRGYTIAPVTIDNADYLFALAYKLARHKPDTTLSQKIGQDYITYMELKLKYFEQQSERLFGRNIPQTLLLHANLLNADHLKALLEMYRQNGYTFVTLDKALEDRAYSTPISAFGRWGISWLDRWALSQGKKAEFFAGDPEVPGYINEIIQENR